MSQIGEPRRIIIADPIYEPVPQVPETEPERPAEDPEIKPAGEPEEVPA